MAVRPVSCIADIMAEGGVVDVVVRSCWGMEKSVCCMPGSLDRAVDTSSMQASQCMGTEKMAW